MIEITFIIPVYNVEAYLEQCICSVLAQTGINKEILLINDGSSDGSNAICERYAEEYEEVKLHNKPNGGLSSARNHGLEQAKGEYVMFVDSDDYLVGNFAKRYYNIAKNHMLDVVRGNYRCFSDQTKEMITGERMSFSYYDKPLLGIQYIKDAVRSKSYEVVVCTSLFRKDFLIDNKLSFKLGLTYEDHEYSLSVFTNPNCRVMHFNDFIYAYRMREGSITKLPTMKNIEDIVHNMLFMSQKISRLDNKDCSQAKQAVSMLFGHMITVWGRLNEKDKKTSYALIPFSCKINSIIYPFCFHDLLKNLLFCISPSTVSSIYKYKSKGV